MSNDKPRPKPKMGGVYELTKDNDLVRKEGKKGAAAALRPPPPAAPPRTPSAPGGGDEE